MKNKTSNYIGVFKTKSVQGTSSFIKYTNNKPWRAQIIKKGKKWQRCYETEREAAMAYDLKLIELGYPPVNILRQKL